MSVTKNVTTNQPSSNVNAGAIRAEWVDTSFLDTSVHQDLMKEFGMMPLAFHHFDITERKISIPNTTAYTVFSKTYPRVSLVLQSAVTTGTGTKTFVVSSGQIVSGNHPFRAGYHIVVPAKYFTGAVVPRLYKITSVSGANLTTYPVNADGTSLDASNITTEIPAGTRLAIAHTAYGPGTGQPTGRTDKWTSNTFRPTELKESGEYEDGVTARDWFRPIKVDLIGGGQKITSKMLYKIGYEMDLQAEWLFWNGEKDDNANLTETSYFGGDNVVRQSEGIFPLANQYAQQAPYVDTIDVFDFDDYREILESAGVLAGHVKCFMGTSPKAMLENAGYDVLKEYGGADPLLKEMSTRLGITIQGITKSGINFSFIPLPGFADPHSFGIRNSDGTFAYPYNEALILIPDIEVQVNMQGTWSRYMSGTINGPGTATFKNLMIAVVNHNGENFDRIVKYEPGVTPNFEGNIAVNQYAGLKIHMRRWIAPIWTEIPKCIFSYKTTA